MDKILNHCLADHNLQQGDCEILSLDNVPINPEDWQTLIASETSTILPIHIRLLSLAEPHKQFSDDGRESLFSNSSEQEGFVQPSTRSFARDSTSEKTGTGEINIGRRESPRFP